MRIGELSNRTGVPTRLLRYYEEQGLLDSRRSANGYRDYDPDAVDRVGQVRGLIDAGIPTAVIYDMLPCLGHVAPSAQPRLNPDVAETLDQRREQLEKRIECLTRNRDAITEYLSNATIVG